MDEKIKARYIDPMVDWSFKRLFGSEVNKDILIEFLKVIFPEHEIDDITYIPAELRDRIFSRLFDVAEYASLDNIDKQNYVKAMTTARDTHNQIEYAKETGLEEGLAKGRAEGREEGRAEGLEEGFEKGRYDMILKMVQNDLPIQTICEITGLSLEEVAKLKDSSGR